MFGIADYGAFVAAIVLFLAIPGPGNLALITSTSKGGVRGGLALQVDFPLAVPVAASVAHVVGLGKKPGRSRAVMITGCER